MNLACGVVIILQQIGKKHPLFAFKPPLKTANLWGLLRNRIVGRNQP